MRANRKYRGALSLAMAGGLAAAMASPAGADTASGVWESNGHRYELVPAPYQTWNDSNVAAQARSWGEAGVCSGYLATVTSAEENVFLFSSFGANLGSKWFGGIQPTSSDGITGWTWSNGEPWTSTSYTNWNAGEPNNLLYPNGWWEDATVFTTTGKWNDAPRLWASYVSGGYVVEYDCLGVSVDVKPGSSQNTVNGNDRGVIPIAILTTETFDAATVNPLTVTMNGAAAKIRGKSMTAGSLEDVDGDGDLDLVVQIVDSDGVFVEGSTTATIMATTYDGITIKGFDTITYVP